MNKKHKNTPRENTPIDTEPVSYEIDDLEMHNLYKFELEEIKGYFLVLTMKCDEDGIKEDDKFIAKIFKVSEEKIHQWNRYLKRDGKISITFDGTQRIIRVLDED